MSMHIYPQTGTFANPETHPLHGFVPLWPAVFWLLVRFLTCLAIDCFGNKIFYTCPNLRQPSCSQRYAIACFGTYLIHAQTCDNPVITLVFTVLHNGKLQVSTYFSHLQTCDNVRVYSATQWTASVHILHMPNL